MANKIEKQKTGLIVIMVVMCILGLCAIGGGITLTVIEFKAMANAISESAAVGGIILKAFGGVAGVALIVVGVIAVIFGVRYLWVGLSVKATNGSIAETNLSKGTVNGKKCPKCGCTNTPDATKCTSCGTDLK